MAAIFATAVAENLIRQGTILHALADNFLEHFALLVNFLLFGPLDFKFALKGVHI